MRKHLLYMLFLSFISLSGCGGVGSEGDPSTTADTSSIVKSLGADGGTAQLSDTAKVTFSSFALSSIADITFKKLSSEPGPISGSRAISGTYQVTVPAGKISSLVFFESLLSGFLNSLHLFDLTKNYITVEIPLDVSSLGSANNYRYVGVKIDNGVNVSQMAGIFSLSNGKVKFSIPPILLGSTRQTISATLYSLDNIPLALQPTASTDIAIYHAANISSFSKAQPTISSSKTPLILIHGIQLMDVLPGSTTSISNAYKETWSVFINHFFANAALSNKYDLYTFRYNTFDSIADNSLRLKNEIARIFIESPNITIVAHSMGGLIANDYIMNGGSNNLVKFIALGTPFHGSQAVHYLEQLMPVPLDIFIPLYNNGALSRGAKDLHWDGSDGNYVETDKYLYVNRSKMNSLDNTTLSKYNVIAGVNPEITFAIKSFADFFTSYESINNDVIYDNDGIVANRSALFSTFSNGSWSSAPKAGITAATFSGLNHVQLHDDSAVLDHITGILLAN